VAIPDYQSVMLPLLEFAGDGQEHSHRETIDALADEFGLTSCSRSNQRHPVSLRSSSSSCF